MPHMRGNRSIVLMLVALHVAALSGPLLLPPTVSAQPATLSVGLRSGWQFWRDEKFSEAVESLNNALKDPSLGPNDRIEALRLLGECKVQLGDEAGAIDAFHQLLDIDKTWVPDPAIFQTTEIDVFNRAKESWKPPTKSRSFFKSPWTLGGGGVVTGVIIYALTKKSPSEKKKESTSTSLPLPPDPPTN